MHQFLVCAYKSQDFAQSQKNCARSHDRETVTFRNSDTAPFPPPDTAITEPCPPLDTAPCPPPDTAPCPTPCVYDAFPSDYKRDFPLWPTWYSMCVVCSL